MTKPRWLHWLLGTGWDLIWKDDERAMHVVPYRDSEPHFLVGTMCDCKPDAEMIRVSLMISHNSYDGRR